MGFATIVSILAIAIALVALWLVSDVLKKVENQNEKFMRAHINSIREEIRNTDREIAKVAKAVNFLTEGADLVEKQFKAQAGDIENARARIAKVAEDLDYLDRSIPQRVRVRVVPPKEAEQKPATKAKPTVQ